MGSTPVKHSVLNVKAVVAAFNQEKALVGAFSVLTNLRIELFQALVASGGAATPRSRPQWPHDCSGSLSTQVQSRISTLSTHRDSMTTLTICVTGGSMEAGQRWW